MALCPVKNGNLVSSFLLSSVLAASALACNSQSETTPSQGAAPASSAKAQQAAPTTQPPGKLVLGAPIENSAVVKLSEIAKNPGAWSGKTVSTTGTVTAVCEHMGCWMEIKDETSEAHIKMAGHSFFVPKTASGHKAKVMGRLGAAAPTAEELACSGEGHKGKGCKAEAEAQMGKPLAKLELEATGVELD